MKQKIGLAEKLNQNNNYENISSILSKIPSEIDTKIKTPKEKEKEFLSKIENIEKRYKSLEKKKNPKLNAMDDLIRYASDTLELLNSNYTNTKEIPNSLSNSNYKITRILLSCYNMKNIINANQLNWQVDKKIEDFRREIDGYKLEISADISKEVNAMKDTLNGMWGNVLSVILSFSIVTAAITAIEKIDKEYIILFLMLIIWLGMTLLVFFCNLFHNGIFERKVSKITYIVYTAFTVLVVFLTLYSYYESGFTVEAENNDCNMEINIRKEDNETHFNNIQSDKIDSSSSIEKNQE